MPMGPREGLALLGIVQPVVMSRLPCPIQPPQDTRGTPNWSPSMDSEEVLGTQWYCMQAGRQSASEPSMRSVLQSSRVGSSTFFSQFSVNNIKFS